METHLDSLKYSEWPHDPSLNPRGHSFNNYSDAPRIVCGLSTATVQAFLRRSLLSFGFFLELLEDWEEYLRWNADDIAGAVFRFGRCR